MINSNLYPVGHDENLSPGRYKKNEIEREINEMNKFIQLSIDDGYGAKTTWVNIGHISTITEYGAASESIRSAVVISKDPRHCSETPNEIIDLIVEATVH